MQKSLPLLSMQRVLRWLLLQETQRGSWLVCFYFHVMYSKNAIKALHYCMEFCWEGHKDRDHLQNSGPGLASHFKHVLSPRLFGAQIFALLSHCSLRLSLYVCVSKQPIRCLGTYALIDATSTHKPQRRDTAAFFLPITGVIELSSLYVSRSRRQPGYRMSHDGQTRSSGILLSELLLR